ncbi:MAG: hypothetical protein QOI61_1982 [Actinomycetota bacterium]
MPVDQALATFTDRYTMVYERTYPHAIDLVFEAVSTGEHLDAWLLPESRVERFEGGKFAFGWGSSADDPAASRGVVSIFDPPTTVEYFYDDGGSYIRFDLSADGAEQTRLLFTLHFLAGADQKEDEWPGGDLPAGLGTPWKPGFLAGFHEFLDDLRTHLVVAIDAEAKLAGLTSGEGNPHNTELIAAYREHVRDNCPPG